MIYAHITNGIIDKLGNPPATVFDAGRWWDLRDRDPALLAARGWLPVVDTPRPDDTDTTTHDYSVQLVAGVPTVTWTPRPWTINERSQRAQLDNLAERVARIEAKLWPPQPDTTPSTDVPTLAAYGGVWPAGALLLDGGKTWRNVTTVPLTTAPSGFPGAPSQWAHLFVLAAAATQPPVVGVPAWSATADYKIGDKVTRGGVTYRCLVAHGAAYGGTWGPPLPSVWAVVP